MRFKQYLFSRTAKNALITLIGNGLLGVIIVIFNILAFRWLGPAQFGIFTVASSITIIVFDVLAFGTSQAIVRFVSVYLGQGKPSLAQHAASAIWRLRLIEITALGLIGVFLGRLLALKFFVNPQLTDPLIVAIWLTGSILLIDFFMGILQAQERFVARSLLFVINALIRLLTLITLYFLGLNTITAFLIAFFSGPLICSLISLFIIPRSFLITPVSASALKPIFHFSKWMALWGVTASLAARLDVLLLAKFTGDYETGLYAAAARLITVFIWAQAAFNTVLEPKTARLIHDLVLLKNNFFKMVLGAFLASFGIIILIPLAPFIMPLLLGRDIDLSIRIFQILLIGMIFFVASTPSMITLMAMGRSKIIGLLSTIQLAVGLILHLWLIPVLGGLGAATAVTSTYFLTFLLSTLSGLRLLKQP